MDNQKAKLRISLLPLVVIIGLILGAGYLLLKGDIDLSKIFNKGPQLRRIEGFPTIIGTSNQVEKTRTVIRSEQELTDFLNKVDSTGLLELKDPINFNKEILVAVSTETENNNGNGIRIKKISEDKIKKKMVVSVIETEKGPTCEVENDKSVGIDIVAVSKTDLPFGFDRIKQYEQCEVKDSQQ